jgi:membrane protein implicated in regulation of membrane protease activity
MPWWGWAIIAFVVLATIKVIVRRRLLKKREAQKTFTDED